MRLNKNASFVLIHLLAGANSAAQISERMPTLTLRSIQRSLVRLNQAGLIDRYGINNPHYSPNYEKVVSQPINTSLLEKDQRPTSGFNFSLLEWLIKDDGVFAKTFFSDEVPLAGLNQITKRELEHLTIELSWKSSALEGNTYSLLDTELLLTRGVWAKNKTSFETQMVLNHKSAIEFIFENPNLFAHKISFATVEEIHNRISYNLGIDGGIRQRVVKITASKYQPPTVPAKLRESADIILDAINQQKDPLAKALVAFSFMPYLQPFEDGNKRIGRILANAILVHSIGRGFSLRGVDAKQLALAYLSFYEFNSLAALAKILKKEIRL